MGCFKTDPFAWHEEGRRHLLLGHQRRHDRRGLDHQTREQGLPRVGDYAKQVLRSPDFEPTNGVTTEVAVLKGRPSRTTTGSRRRSAPRPQAQAVQAERRALASSVRSSRTRRSKRWVCGTSLPCTNPSTTPTAIRTCWVRAVAAVVAGSTAYHGRPDGRWVVTDGFAFAVSQVSS